jgi:hypothetical protein
MKLEEIILQNSSVLKAKLFTPALRAFEAPETGIQVIKPAAVRVIKDCAETTIKFLPIEIFLQFKTPIEQLRGKFTREIIQEFYDRSKNELHTKLLLDLMLATCPKINTVPLVKSTTINDPYGDYDSVEPVEITNTADSVELIFKTYS